MAKIKLNLGSRSYDIIIGKNIISSLPKRLKKLQLLKYQPVVVTNNRVYKIYGEFLKERLIGYSKPLFLRVPDSEKAKSWQVLSNALKTIVEFNKDKNIF